MIDTCKNCKFYFDFECRRFPPQVTTYTYIDYSYDSETQKTATESHFPVVQNEEWCGEFKCKGNE